MIRCKLSDLLDTKSGSTPPTTNEIYYKNGKIPWLTSGEVSQGIIRDNEHFVTEIAFKNTSLQIIPRGSTLIAMYGATVGQVGFLTFDSTINQAICAIMPNKNVADPRYVYYYFTCHGRSFKDLAAGSARTNISQATIQNFPLILPDMECQYRIAELLSTMDKSIATSDEIALQLANIIHLIYNYWFVQFDFPDENGRPYKSSGGKMVYNDQLKQEIPEGWECKKLINLFDFVRGTEVGSDAYADKKISDGYMRFWRVRDVGNDCKTWIDGNARNLTAVKPGDVVITLDGTVGKIGIDLDGAISGGLRHVVDHTNTISNATICAILQSDYVQESLRQYVSGRGSILAHASGALQHLAIPYDKNIFNKFQNIIQPMFDLMVNSKKQSKQLASLRDWLLPMLMNGQVEIRERKEASNDQV